MSFDINGCPVIRSIPIWIRDNFNYLNSLLGYQVSVCKENFMEAGSHSFDNTKFSSEFVCYIFVHLSHSGLIIGVITYCQTSNISWTLVGITIVDHSDVIGASAVGVCSNYIIILDFNTWLYYIPQIQLQDRMKKIKFCDLVQLILEIWRQSNIAYSLKITKAED